jgi:hypothetical protein
MAGALTELRLSDALLEALETGHWLKAAFWVAIGLVFLRADALRRPP